MAIQKLNKTVFVPEQILLAEDVQSHVLKTNEVIDELNKTSSAINTVTNSINTLEVNVDSLENVLNDVKLNVDILDSSVKQIETIINDLNPDTSNKLDVSGINYINPKKLPYIDFEYTWKIKDKLYTNEYMVATPGDSVEFDGKWFWKYIDKENEQEPIRTYGSWGNTLPDPNNDNRSDELYKIITNDTPISQTIIGIGSGLMVNEDNEVYYSEGEKEKTKEIGVHFVSPLFYGSSEKDFLLDTTTNINILDSLEKYQPYNVENNLSFNINCRDGKYFYLVIPKDTPIIQTIIENNIYNDWETKTISLEINTNYTQYYVIYRSKYKQTAENITVNIVTQKLK